MPGGCDKLMMTAIAPDCYHTMSIMPPPLNAGDHPPDPPAQADLVGDVGFVCGDALSNHTSADNYSVISSYELEVFSAWGQYAVSDRLACFVRTD
jgi:hypothetical protein